MSDNNETNWSEVGGFFDDVVEAARDGKKTVGNEHLEVLIYSPVLDKTLEVIIPKGQVDSFMKRLTLWQSNVFRGRPRV